MESRTRECPARALFTVMMLAVVLAQTPLASGQPSAASSTVFTSSAQDGGVPVPGAEPRFRIDLDFQYMFGEADGFVQTPAGGEPGTTSPNRPTLDEIGIDHVHILDASLSLQFNPHIFTFGGQFIRMSGSATLGSDLISQSLLFPAGSSVDSDVQLDWYRFGYQYDFRFDLGNGHELHLAPGVQGVLLDFRYELDGPGGLRADRSYAKGGAGIGATIQWLTDGPFSVEASGFWGLPIDKTAEILTLELVAKWQVWGSSQSNGGAAYLGVAFETIEYEDNQTVPNHINVDLGPVLVAGLEIRF